MPAKRAPGPSACPDHWRSRPTAAPPNAAIRRPTMFGALMDDCLSQLLRAPVQQVAETAVQPCLASRLIVLRIDRFVADVREVAT